MFGGRGVAWDGIRPPLVLQIALRRRRALARGRVGVLALSLPEDPLNHGVAVEATAPLFFLAGQISWSRLLLLDLLFLGGFVGRAVGLFAPCHFGGGSLRLWSSFDYALFLHARRTVFWINLLRGTLLLPGVCILHLLIRLSIEAVG